MQHFESQTLILVPELTISETLSYRPPPSSYITCLQPPVSSLKWWLNYIVFNRRHRRHKLNGIHLCFSFPTPGKWNLSIWDEKSRYWWVISQEKPPQLLLPLLKEWVNCLVSNLVLIYKSSDPSIRILYFTRAIDENGGLLSFTGTWGIGYSYCPLLRGLRAEQKSQVIGALQLQG